MSFTFAELFAGIGGFHGALSAAGGKCVFASEIDKYAAEVYRRNWGITPEGDITKLDLDSIPLHDVLVGGFPCQPFSKSGKQLGMDETRGTLFWNITQVIKHCEPKIVLLENVRNLVGPNHIHEWNVILKTLRDLGYRVSNKPLILSPHTIHPFFGGTPQVRERVFICATKMNKTSKKELYLEPGIPDVTSITEEWDPSDWDLFKDLPILNKKDRDQKAYALGRKEQNWLNAWNDFVMLMRENQIEIPGFPIWTDDWVHLDNFQENPEFPEWKNNFLKKNSIFYTKNIKKLNSWRKKWKISEFPASRRKFEWQAQDSLNLKSCIIHFRPSGIRVKKPNYVPTLVAMNQTTILGKEYRKLTPRECARLQGFPEWFDQNRQEESLSYKQLGNAVNISVAYHVFRAQIKRDIDLLIDYPNLIKTVLDGPNNPVKKLNELDQLDIQLVDTKNSFPSKNKQLKIN